MILGTMEKQFSIRGTVINNKGLVRRNNEDNFYLNGIYLHRAERENGAFLTKECQDSVQLYAVCDGMGGTDTGEEASYMAVKELAAWKRWCRWLASPRRLASLLQRISDRIHADAVKKSQKSGTTIALALIRGERIVMANVGDSRIYRFREGHLEQMSADHSVVQKLVSMGLMSPEAARISPDRHVITQYLGMDSGSKIFPYISPDTELSKEEMYLLCSDGLTDMVDDHQIEAILREKRDSQEAAKELLAAALRNGGRDNITIILLST